MPGIVLHAGALEMIGVWSQLSGRLQSVEEVV